MVCDDCGEVEVAIMRLEIWLHPALVPLGRLFGFDLVSDVLKLYYVLEK